MKNNRGSAMLLAIGILFIVTAGVSATLTWFHAAFDYTNAREARQVCAHIAEAGLDKALAELQAGNIAYTGESKTPIGDGTVSVTVAPAQRPGWLVIQSTGRLPRGANTVTVRLREDVRLDHAGSIAAAEWREVRQ